MLSDEIEPTIMVAEYNNFTLIYDGVSYHLGFTNNEETILSDYPANLTAPTELKNIVNANDYEGITPIAEKPTKKQSRGEKDLIFLHSQINSKNPNNSETIISELITALGDIAEELKAMGNSTINEYNINNLADDKVIAKIKELSEAITIEKNSYLYLANGGKKGQIVQVTNNPALKKGLYYKTKHYNNETKSYDNVYTLIGNILIHKLTLTYDKLKNSKGENLFPPVATIQYTNTTTNQTVTLKKQPYEAIANNLINNRLIDSNNLGVENLLNKIWVQGVNNHDFITAETDLLKDGFFMDMETGKVLSNNVFENLESTPNDVAEAIKLFNEIIRDRGTAIPNDCTLFRFMLWSPFAYCLKQMGFTDGLYSMVLWGVTDTNKTGSSVMFSNLYTDKATTLQKANTQSAIGTRLGENTFPLILDEAKDNLINPNDEEFNKNIVTDEMGRAVKDRTNNNLMVEFPALRLTVRTLNQNIDYKDEFLKRHKVLYYDNTMQVKEAEKEEFNKRFKPNAPNTPLKQLKHLGRAFADKFIPYLESQSDKLYNLEDLTIEILKEIQRECNTEFNLNVMIKQKITAQSTDNASIIQNGLNKIFTTAYKLPYNHNGYMEQDFKNAVKMGAIKWLDYQPRKELFIIKVADFEKDISVIVGNHIPIAETMELLNIKYEYGERVKFKGGAFPCIKLNTYNLTYKLFGINIYDFEELEELQAEELETEEREAEADNIVNRESI